MKTKIHFLIVLSLILAQLSFSVQSVRAQALPAENASVEAGIDPDWLAQAQAYIDRSEYFFTLSDRGNYQAPNRAQGLRFTLSQDSLRIIDRLESEPTWSFSLRPLSLGSEKKFFSQYSLAASENQMAFAYAAGLQVKYTNSDLGLQQRLILQAPLGRAPRSSVQFALTVDSNLTPHRLDASAFEFRQSGLPRLHYRLVSASDATGRALPANLELSAETGTAWQIQVTIQAEQAAYPLEIQLSITGLSRTSNWYVFGQSANNELGRTLATAGDVNGDGYSDVIVGAPYFSGFATEIGRVMIYYGSKTGLPATPAWTQDGVSAYEHFGWAVASAGDVNGDGYSDVLISTSTGFVYLYLGAAGGLSNSTFRIYQEEQSGSDFGSALATAGDVNGDGYSDFAIAAPKYLVGEDRLGRVYVHCGSPSGPDYTPDWVRDGLQDDALFGASLATAGDTNGDGYSDLLIGAPNYIQISVGWTGAAYLYRGYSGVLQSSPSWMGQGPAADYHYGKSVHTAGDVNGDGYSDIIIGATYHYMYSLPGYAYVYYGSASGPGSTPDWSKAGAAQNDTFGASVSTAGDVNGDGYADVIIGANMETLSGGYTSSGAAYVFHGSVAGLQTDAAWSDCCYQNYSLYGWGATTAGDVNGDGYSDILVSAPWFDYNSNADAGMALVYHGGPDNLSLLPGWSYASGYANKSLGRAVSSAGDIDGDGYADLLIGAPYYDSSYVNEGAVFLWRGSSAGPNTGGPDWWARGNQADAYFGWSVANAGDVNGDGYTDILVGAPYYDYYQVDGGLYALWYGAPSLSGSATVYDSDWYGGGDLPYAYAGTSVAGAGDLNGDGFADIAVGVPGYADGQSGEGAVFVWYSSGFMGPNNPASPDWLDQSDLVEGGLGISVSSAGDVNRDGYSDLIAGGKNFAAGWHGSANGLPTDTVNWFAAGMGSSDLFGASVSTAGDINGDGYSDIVVGAPFRTVSNTLEGAAYAYCGGPGGLATSFCWTDLGGRTNAWFGWSVGSGDFNGDGYSDLAVGAPSWTNAYSGQGQARVYYGSEWAPVSYNGGDWNVEGNAASSALGFSVAAAGDVNGDGYADLLVGQPGYAGAGADEGRALLYYGNGAPGRPFLPQQLRTVDLRAIAPLGKTLDDNTFYVTGKAFSPAGQGLVYLCVEARSLTNIFSGDCTHTSNWYMTGLPGASIQQAISGLPANSIYHWRMRVHYDLARNPFNPPNSRWVHRPWNGWNEADLRTWTLSNKIYLPVVTRQ